eukprot:11637163-Alexandrium_andersonii.AAC.1
MVCNGFLRSLSGEATAPRDTTPKKGASGVRRMHFWGVRGGGSPPPERPRGKPLETLQNA